jgi:hypothetical protein
MTQLTDRWHRRLAEQGYFPPPIRGSYEKDKTLAGIIAYYRDKQRRITATIAEDKASKLSAD